MNTRDEEWDWPPPRRPHRTPSFEGRIERKAVVFGRPRRPSWPNRAADLFFRLMVGMWKVAFAVFLTGLLIACMWLIGALLDL